MYTKQRQALFLSVSLPAIALFVFLFARPTSAGADTCEFMGEAYSPGACIPDFTPFCGDESVCVCGYGGEWNCCTDCS